VCVFECVWKERVSACCQPPRIEPTSPPPPPPPVPALVAAMGAMIPGSEIVIGFQAVDCMLSLLAALELMAEALVTNPSGESY
jgi:hypothetical protein